MTIASEDRRSAPALAIDLGGTKIEAALVTPEGTVVDGSRVRRPTGRDVTSDALRGAIGEVVAGALAALVERTPGNRDQAAGLPEQQGRGGSAGTGTQPIAGAGIGSAGPIDLAEGTISPVNMPGVHGFDLADAVCAALTAHGIGEVPVKQRHDGGCLALAESWIGQTCGAHASLSIVVSTGIGGGLVLNGAPMPGASGNAGHLGQTVGWRAAGAGEALTLEEVASGPASVAWARSQGWAGSTGEELARSAAEGERIARAAIERSAEAVGRALADAATLIDLDVIAIGGGFSRVSEDYVELVAAALRSAAVLPYAARARVVRSGLGDTGPLVGAAALVLRA